MLSTNDVIPLIESRNEYGVEIDRPNTVVGFLQTDVLIDERVGDVKKLVVKAECPAGGDLLYDEMARVLENRKF